MAEFSDARQRWNQRYLQEQGFLFGVEPNQWVLQQQHRIASGAKVLSVADGEGRNAVFAASLGAEVTAFDISDAAVARARQLAADAGVKVDFHRSDVSEWAWQEGYYDVVLAVFVQFAGPVLRQQLFAGIDRCLKLGGVVLIEGYGPRQIDYRSGGPGVLENYYTLDLLQHSWPGYSMLACRDEDADLAEGLGHRGKAHLVSAVMQKHV